MHDESDCGCNEGMIEKDSITPLPWQDPENWTECWCPCHGGTEPFPRTLISNA